MPQLVIKSHPCNPVVVPVVPHQRQVYPLQGQLSDLSTQIWIGPYLLIRRVVSPITSVEVETSVLTRDLVPHGVFEGAVID